MKLAEALKLRKDLNARATEIRNRLIQNSKVQEGMKPLEDPVKLQQELSENLSELTNLICRINLTNNSTMVDGRRLGDLVVERDNELRLCNYLKELASSASQLVDRYSKTEILIKPTVSVPEIQKEIDSKAKKVRELDNLIQAQNWLTDLL